MLMKKFVKLYLLLWKYHPFPASASAGDRNDGNVLSDVIITICRMQLKIPLFILLFFGVQTHFQEVCHQGIPIFQKEKLFTVQFFPFLHFSVSKRPFRYAIPMPTCLFIVHIYLKLKVEKHHTTGHIQRQMTW